MPENPYIRERTFTVTVKELVPDKEQLPYCAAWQKDGSNCPNRAKYVQDGYALCGVHMGKPGTIFSEWKK